MDFSLQGRNISTGRLCASIPPANWLLDRYITSIGTLNANRIDVPDEVKGTRCSEEFSNLPRRIPKERYAIEYILNKNYINQPVVRIFQCYQQCDL